MAKSALECRRSTIGARLLVSTRIGLGSWVCPSDAELIKTIKELLGEDVAHAISAGLGVGAVD